MKKTSETSFRLAKMSVHQDPLLIVRIFAILVSGIFLAPHPKAEAAIVIWEATGFVETFREHPLGELRDSDFIQFTVALDTEATPTRQNDLSAEYPALSFEIQVGPFSFDLDSGSGRVIVESPDSVTFSIHLPNQPIVDGFQFVGGGYRIIGFGLVNDTFAVPTHFPLEDVENMWYGGRFDIDYIEHDRPGVFFEHIVRGKIESITVREVTVVPVHGAGVLFAMICMAGIAKQKSIFFLNLTQILKDKTQRGCNWGQSELPPEKRT